MKPTSFRASAYPMIPLTGFSQHDVAASQTAVALKLNANAATTGELDVLDYVMPFDGSIVGITIVLDTNKTAGVLTFAPTIDGTALAAGTGMSAVAVATGAREAYKFIEADTSGAQFVAGANIGVKMTSDGSFTPVNADVYVVVWVVWDRALV